MATVAPENQKKSPAKLILILGLIALVIIGVLMTQNKNKPAETIVKTEPVAATETPVPDVPNRPVPQEAPPAEETAQEPESNAERAYLVEDFRDTEKNWSQYKMKGTAITPEGIKLQDGQTEGDFESPCTALKLPSNMVAFLWKETLPDGTVVKPEIRLSHDCQSWSPWYPIESTGNDINPLYPDGSPNPNYGYVPGSYVSLGLDLVPFIQYRLKLMRTDLSKGSPVVPGARFYHLDSTLGDGKTITDVSKYPPGAGEATPNPEETTPAETKAEN